MGKTIGIVHYQVGRTASRWRSTSGSGYWRIWAIRSIFHLGQQDTTPCLPCAATWSR